MTEYTPLTEEEKFLFDLKGYLLFPSVLDEDEIATLKDQALRIEHDPKSLPGGAAAMLIDHPAVMSVLHAIIGKTEQKFASRAHSATIARRTTRVGLGVPTLADGR